ncbi:MAG: DUF4401 domain-containing protein, partial [Zoogloeaceae bacterium]|nr:DUF4401 domain-containing protein [Zoogloeaceae bacterium]
MSLDFSALAALYARLQAAPDDQDFRALADAARPWQPGKASWRALLTALCGTGGVLLLVSALIFFFAWNWAALPRLTKLSLADAAFLLCCLTAAAACFVRQGQGGGLWRTALFGACLCAGAWFALIGQLYQTGADVWQLFALWALFTLPLTLLSRSTATAILWLLIANLALFIAPLWSGELPAGDAYWREITARQMVFNLLMLTLLEIGGPRWLAVPRRWPQRLVVFLALLPGVAWACIDVFGEHWQKISSAWLVLSLGWLMVYHGGRYGAKRYPADLPILAIVLTGLITVATCLVGKLTISERFWREDGFGLFGFFLTGLALILMSGAATVWLTRLHVKASAHAALERETPLRTDEPEPMPAPPEPLHQALAAAPLFPPVWLTVLQGAAAWVAALLILPWLFLLVDESAAWIVPGVLLLGAACWLLRARKGIFAEQLGLAASLSGQGVLVGWLWLYVFDDLWRGQTPGLLLGVCAALIAAGMTWLKTPRLHRSLCAMLALGWLCLGLLNFFDTASDIWREDRRMQVVWMQFEALSTCALAVWLWLARPQSIGGKRAALAQSVAEGAAFVAVALLIVIGLVLGNEHSSFVHAQAALPGMSGWDWLYGAGAAALLALVARRVGGNRAMLAALPFLALGIWQPWLALVLCLILAAFFAAERFGLALSLIAGGLLLGNFYYVLHLSLLAKSAALAAGGVLLLAALIVARRRLGEAGPSSG